MSRDDILLPDHTIAPKRVLIAGANGQLGWELQRTAPAGIEIIALDRNSLDICDQDQINKVVAELAPDMVINAAAYTAVDKAEQEPELAFMVNATAAGYLAEAAHTVGAKLIHISTDFVFSGNNSTPYLPDDAPDPLGVYGASKLKGEELVRKFSKGEVIILRTAWVYSVHGANFVKTMLKMMGEREELSVVYDQYGSPAWAHELADTIWKLFGVEGISGVYHWSDDGVISWHDFAVAIQGEAHALGILKRKIPIIKISAADFQSNAKRPAYSVLDKSKTIDVTGKKALPWRESLNKMLREIVCE